MKTTLRALATAALLLAPAPLLAQASGNAGWVEQEGCWCGYQTSVGRDYWIRGRNAAAAEKQAAADMLTEAGERTRNTLARSLDRAPKAKRGASPTRRERVETSFGGASGR